MGVSTHFLYIRNITNTELFSLEAVESQGFSKMTPVQASVIPLFRENKDVVVEAVTGSGKTLAFLVPVLERVLRIEDALKPGQTHSVIISPTRELAQQIFQVLNLLLKYCPEDKSYHNKKRRKIRSQLIVGGDKSSHSDLQVFLSRIPNILIGTPGRLLELLSSPQVKISQVDNMVLDEADRLLELGFDVSVKTIIGMLPQQKRAGLFSATMSESINEIAQIGLRNPFKIMVKVGSDVAVSDRRIPLSLGISYAVTKPMEKLPLLIDMLQKETFKKAIVYFSTCHGVDYFYHLLSFFFRESQGCGIEDIVTSKGIHSLHGKLISAARKKALEKFSLSSTKSVLLTTDVAARGLDIPDVDLVIQYDPPSDHNIFLHRSGRAARAGKIGQSVVFLNEGREERYVDFMAVKMIDMEQYIFYNSKLSNPYERIRQWMLYDRLHFDLAVRAYVSYIRFYSKHTATSIFRLQSFSFVENARAYGLLRLPGMPELKLIPNDEIPENGWLGEIVDMDKYGYVNKRKEKERQIQLLEKNSKSEKIRKKIPIWAEKREKAERRQDKRKLRHEAKLNTIRKECTGSSDEEASIDWKDLVKERKNKRAKTAMFNDL